MIPITEFPGTLAEKKMLTEEVMLLSFSVPESFTFSAGQYVMIAIECQGVVRLRPYSILNPPSQRGRIDLCVKLIHDGFASEVFRAAPKGQQFQFRGPLGHFCFDERAADHWFICTGTGITPLYSMIMENISRFPHKKFNLLFGEKTRKNLLFYDELRTLEKEYKNFTYIPTVTQDLGEGKTGRVQQHLPSDLLNKTFYICGLREMVLETKELLLNRGVHPEKIQVERYT